MSRYTALLALLSVWWGCRAGDEFGMCDKLEVSASPGSQPTIGWADSECGVYRLTVEQSGAIRWDITMTQLTNGIHLPVAYGVAPPGTQGSQAVQLTLGPYDVTLFRLDDENRLELAGQARFSNQ